MILNCIIGASVGVWIGSAISKYIDFHTHLELYAMNSAPWYTGILLQGIVTVIVVIIVVIIKLVVRRKMNKNNGEQL